MVDRHVVASLSLLGLGGLVLWHLPLRLPGPADVALVGASCAALLASHWASRVLGPWGGALFAWFVGASVPLLTFFVGALAEFAASGPSAYLWHRHHPLLLEDWRRMGGLLYRVAPFALAFGAAFAVVQLASRRAALWQRLGVAALAPPLFSATITLMSRGFWLRDSEPFFVLAGLVLGVGCLRGVDYPEGTEVLRPVAHLAQRLAGRETSDPEPELHAWALISGRVAGRGSVTRALLEARARS